jgi:hypothetical protein
VRQFCCVLGLHGGRSDLYVREATALAEPFQGAGQVVKESIHVAEHEGRAPELALALDPRALRGDWDSKSGPKSAQKEASDDDNSPRCRQPSSWRRHPMKRSALFIVFFCFFKVQQTVHKTTFYSGPPSVPNSPAMWASNRSAAFQIFVGLAVPEQR